jgi:hypothetical protein
MKNLTILSIEPISIQYDQTLNRLKTLSNEIQLRLSQVQQINPTLNPDPSFEQNHLQLIIHFENAQENIRKLINDREQIQLSAQTLDENVFLINQNVKLLRTNLEHYRLTNDNIQEFQVKKIIYILIHVG